MTTSRCVRDHTVRGEHLDPLTPGDDPAHPGCPAGYLPCKGCRPAYVADGTRELLCEGCGGVIARVLLDAAPLVGHIRDHVQPGTYMPRQDVLREAPAPLNVAAVDDADALFAVLLTWALRYAGARRLTGPDYFRHHVRWDASGWPVGLSPTAPGFVTSAVTDWLLDHRSGLACGLAPDRDAAGDDVRAWFRDIVDTHTRIAGRWPRTPAERRLPLPCPSCNRLTLHMHPPKAEGHPVQVMCHVKTCGRAITEDDYYWHIHEAQGARR